MDKLDKEIIQILEEDGRESYTDIAEKVDVTEATVRNRVTQMKKNSVIKKFTVETSKSDKIQAFVIIELGAGVTPEDVYSSIPDIDLYEITGKHDAIAMIEAEKPEEINEEIDNIRSREGVEYTETKMILNKR